MATIRFDKAGVFSWENTYDELVEEAMSDPSDILYSRRKTRTGTRTVCR